MRSRALRRLACLLFSLFVPALALAVDGAPVTLTITPENGRQRVSVLFPEGTTRPVGEAAIGTLLARSGWAAGEQAWSTSPAQKGFPAQRAVDFYVADAFPGKQFPLEALAVAFRGFGSVLVLAYHGGALNYTGARTLETKDIELRVSPSPSSFSANLVIKNPSLEKLELPQLVTPAGQAPPRAEAREESNPWFWVAIGLAVAIVTFIVVYALASRAGRPPRAGTDAAPGAPGP